MIQLLLLLITSLLVLFVQCETDLTKEPGHLQKFGTGRPVHPVDEVVGFPSPQQFFKEYFLPQKPVKFLTGAKLSPAFYLWTDEYFLNLDIPKTNRVNLETVKKENRQQETVMMSFKKFVKIYRNTTYYMVDPVPDYLKPDLILPCSLQCPGIMKNKLVDILMWFSGGGTNSVVHRDGVDNINCVYRGTKDFVIVDPVKYEDMVPIDRPEGSYSDIDVDRVDYVKYPTLAQVEYIHAHLEPGDCLYIPYNWIHQVRSYNSNLAVNIWWNHYDALDVDLSDCNKECDKSLSIDKLQTTGFDFLLSSHENLRDHLSSGVASSPTKSIDYDSFIKFILPVLQEAENDDLVKEEVDQIRNIARKLVNLLDGDEDGNISVKEIAALESAKLLEVMGLLRDVDVLQRKMDAKVASMDPERYEADDEDVLEDILLDDVNEKDEL